MSDCTCSLDYDPADVYKAKIHTARKEHTCHECGYKIQPGERYEYVFGVWCAGSYTFHTCERCLDLRELIAQHTGGCWMHGGLFETYGEVLSELSYGLPDKQYDEVTETPDRVMDKHRHGKPMYDSVYHAELNLKTARRKLNCGQLKQASLLCNACEEVLGGVIDAENLDTDYAGAVALELIRMRNRIKQYREKM